MKKVKTKIINDPVHGFITVPSGFLLSLIDHPYFQRLRRIKQLGLTDWVYPGAMHTRFNHALGAMFLMHQAIISLRQKGHKITSEEKQASLAAILLHDIGHGPFSHALENSLVNNLSHEDVSHFYIKKLIKEIDGPLDLALEIFEGNYHKKFLHELIASQLDVDRMDYLRRDSFFTGVSEGVIGTQRIIKMLNIIDDQLVVEQKGIHSIENFISSRRIMYLQVYLHKTVLAAEQLLINILKRANEVFQEQGNIFAAPALKYFLKNNINKVDFENGEALEMFSQLDDNDIMNSIKVWGNHSDKTLSLLSKSLVERRLYKTEIQNDEFEADKLERLTKEAVKFYDLDPDLASYLVFEGKINTEYYSSNNEIKLLQKDDTIIKASEVSDEIKNALNNPIKKCFLNYPKYV